MSSAFATLTALITRLPVSDRMASMRATLSLPWSWISSSGTFFSVATSSSSRGSTNTPTRSVRAGTSFASVAAASCGSERGDGG